MVPIKSQSVFRVLFSRFKNAVWPVKEEELKKFFTMSALMFCVLFNQNILRVLKDSIIIPEISAEVISFVKIYCVTPVAALFIILYTKMVNKLSYIKIYYYLLATFVVFFLLFAMVLYPNAATLHISEIKSQALINEYPSLKWYIILIGNWSCILFYVLSELWPNIFYVLLFWQLANQITTTEQAKRFYSLFSLFGNSSVIIVGIMVMHFASEKSILKKYFTEIEDKILLIQSSVILVTVVAIITAFLLYVVIKISPTDKLEVSKKPTLGLLESFKYIASSRYLWLIVICSASFGLSMNLIEAVWKAKIRELYPTVNSYAEITGFYILWTGITITIMNFIGNSIIRYCSWFVAAIISPLIIMISGTIFFTLVVFDIEVINGKSLILSPIALAVLVGGVQNVLAKGTKYSIWDTSREMLYIPLDSELKVKGKAASDLVSSKIGKSFSSLIQVTLFTIFHNATYDSISPVMMVIFIAVCILWLVATKETYKEYTKKLSTTN